MTKIAKCTVLRNLELAPSLCDLQWWDIKRIAQAKIYNKDVIQWAKFSQNSRV